MVSARTATETERVRNTLLASISHDFRTPLSSILGSATSLIDYGGKLDAAAKMDLLSQIKQEAESLDEMVRNLLAITRIDAGALELRRDWIDLREIADRVVSAARRRGAKQRIEVTLPADLPLVRADATLVEQAIGNVIGNAIVHTAPESRVMVDAIFGAKEIALRVTDDGPDSGRRIALRARQVHQGRHHPGRWRTRDRTWSCYCERHHGGAWRRYCSSEPGARRAWHLHNADIPM